MMNIGKVLWKKTILFSRKQVEKTNLFIQTSARDVKTKLQILWKGAVPGAKKWLRKITKNFWLLSYKFQNKFHCLWLQLRDSHLFYLAISILFFVGSLILSFSFQNELTSYFSKRQELEQLSTLILEVGIALIGASAIVTSLVFFAMQINIERMPYGLFHRLSDDWRLLSIFVLTFLLALGLAVSSVFLSQSNVIFLIPVSFGFSVVILSLFRNAYSRALFLVNPIQQIGILINDANKELQSWDKKARRISPLLEQGDVENNQSSSTSTYDSARTAFFMKNKQWDNSAKRALQYAMSFARRYAEQGDYEVSKCALGAIISINSAYIEAKGKTFYAATPMVESPFVNDSFINETLEQLRQASQVAVSRRDEQQIKQIIGTIAALHRVYLKIDYSTLEVTKIHAAIAARYLSEAIQTVVPHDMADVLLEGQRLMGQSAQQIIIQGNPDDITTLSERIALTAIVGCINEKYFPVTMEGMRQLASLTIALLCCKARQIRFAVREVHRDATFVAKSFLKVPNVTLSNIHSDFLGPYYSSISTQSLRLQFTILCNAISEAKPDDPNAKVMIDNIEQWADSMCQLGSEKDLLLTAIKEKSNFTFDMIYWVTGVTEILLAISNALACDNFHKLKIRQHARWLIMTLYCIPEDEKTVIFVENFRMTEKLFEAAMSARNNSCDEIANEIAKMLLSWIFKAGRHETGWEILERGLCGIAVFYLTGGEKKISELKKDLEAILMGKFSLTEETRERTAKNVIEYFENLDRQGYWVSEIDREVARADSQKLRHILEEIASLLRAPQS
jgi:hypothetical protein